MQTDTANTIQIRSLPDSKVNVKLKYQRNAACRNMSSFQIMPVNLTFIGPCIVIYSYRTTNKMHPFLKLFILVKSSTCFGRSFRPSSGAQNCTYGNRHMSNSCCYLLLRSCLTYTCCRMCSFELLMMDGKTVRNM